MRIPELLLEEIHLGEKNASDYYNMYGKEALDSAVSRLDTSDAQILAQYPSALLRRAVEEKLSGQATEGLSSTKSNVPQKKRFLRPSAVLRFSAACAAVCAVAFAIPAVMKRGTVSAAASGSEIRVKGNALPAKSLLSLNVYLKDGNAVKELKNGFRAAAGDVIQITYTPGRNDYGIIFSVDGSGNVTRHFPEDGWTAAELTHSGGEIPLDFSYELDDAPDFEYFVFAASKNAFSLDNIETMMTARQTDAAFIKNRSYLPADVDARLFLLRKK